MTDITLEQAEQIAARIEAANAEHLALLERQEKLRAQEVLGGRSEAGITVVVDKDKQRTDEINERLKHTGLHI